MGIQIETTIYGGTIGRALANDPEELAYALAEMSRDDATLLGTEIVASAPYGSCDRIVTFLRCLADAIEAEGGQ